MIKYYTSKLVTHHDNDTFHKDNRRLLLILDLLKIYRYVAPIAAVKEVVHQITMLLLARLLGLIVVGPSQGLFAAVVYISLSRIVGPGCIYDMFIKFHTVSDFYLYFMLVEI